MDKLWLLAAVACVCLGYANCDANYTYVEEDVPDEYILMLKDIKETLKDSPIAELIRSIAGCELLQEVKMKARRYARLKFNNTRIADILARIPEVEFVEKNKRMKYVPEAEGDEMTVQAYSTPSTDCTGRVMGPNGWGPTRIAYRNIPNYNTDPYIYSPYDDGHGVRIYIVDSGIKTDHVDFEGRAVFGMVGSQIAHEGPGDDNGHGTHVAGIAGGKEYGVAPKATLVDVKVIGKDGFATTADILEGLNWIMTDVAEQDRAAGKKTRVVVNMSLGGPGAVRSMETAVRAAIEDNIPVVIAAGNDNQDACGFSPARVSQAITVGATDSQDRLATFSNWGRCVDILAPGVQITAPHPDNRRLLRRNNVYQRLSGTSQACPHVAGAVARYLSSLTDDVLLKATPTAIESLALNTATVNRVNMRGMRNTPNYLLFKDCAPNDVNFNIFETDWTEVPAGGSGKPVVSFVSVVLMTCISLIKMF